MICPTCLNRGAVRVRYRSGEPDDLALCRCTLGRNLRRLPDDEILKWLRVPAPDRIGCVEDFEDDPDAALTADLAAVGRVKK